MSRHVTDLTADYLARRLSAPERESFEAHVAACDDCRSEVEWARRLRSEALRQGLRHIDPLRLVALAAPDAEPTPDEAGHLERCTECRREREWAAGLGDDDEDSPGQPAGPAPRRLWPWLAAAAAAVVAIVFMVPTRGPGFDPAGLVDLEPLPVRITRSAPEPGSFDEARLAGLDAYAAGDYATARAELARALELRPDATEVRLYRGSAALLDGERERAGEDLLDVVAASTAGPVRDEAEWLLANLALLDGDVETARERLAALTARDGRRTAAARTLLEALPTRE